MILVISGLKVFVSGSFKKSFKTTFIKILKNYLKSMNNGPCKSYRSGP